MNTKITAGGEKDKKAKREKMRKQTYILLHVTFIPALFRKSSPHTNVFRSERVKKENYNRL